MITAWVIIYMSYAGPVVLGRYADRKTCEVVAENEGAKCAMAVER